MRFPIRAPRQRLGLRRLYARRHRLAGRFLRGEGIEIGALHVPMRLPKGARAHYVGRYDVEGLRHHPELSTSPLVPIDVIAEHLRVVRPGGTLFSALPDQRAGIDAKREDVRAPELREAACSVHVHAWTPAAFAAVLTYGRDVLRSPYQNVAPTPNRSEFLLVLRRSR